MHVVTAWLGLPIRYWAALFSQGGAAFLRFVGSNTIRAVDCIHPLSSALSLLAHSRCTLLGLGSLSPVCHLFSRASVVCLTHWVLRFGSTRALCSPACANRGVRDAFACDRLCPCCGPPCGPPGSCSLASSELHLRCLLGVIFPFASPGIFYVGVCLRVPSVFLRASSLLVASSDRLLSPLPLLSWGLPLGPRGSIESIHRSRRVRRYVFTASASATSPSPRAASRISSAPRRSPCPNWVCWDHALIRVSLERVTIIRVRCQAFSPRAWNLWLLELAGLSAGS